MCESQAPDWLVTLVLSGAGVAVVIGIVVLITILIDVCFRGL